MHHLSACFVSLGQVALRSLAGRWHCVVLLVRYRTVARDLRRQASQPPLHQSQLFIGSRRPLGAEESSGRSSSLIHDCAVQHQSIRWCRTRSRPRRMKCPFRTRCPCPAAGRWREKSRRQTTCCCYVFLSLPPPKISRFCARVDEGGAGIKRKRSAVEVGLDSSLPRVGHSV